MTPIRLKLFPRFLIVLLLLTVIPVSLVGLLIVRINDDSLQKQVQRYHIELAASLANRLDERVATIQSQLFLGVTAIQNPTMSWEAKQAFLRSLLDSSEQFGIISVLTVNGQELIKVFNPVLAPDLNDNPTLITHASLAPFRTLQKSGKQVMEVSRTNGKTFAEVYLPIKTPSGTNAMYAKFSLNDIVDIISQKTIGLTGCATYVGQNGELLSVPQNPLQKNEQIINEQSIVKTALAGSLGSREFKDERGTLWVGASAPVTKLGGAIITQQKREEAYADVIRGKKTAGITVLITLLIAILAATLLTKSLVNPLLVITQIAQEVDVANGHFPDPIVVKSRDEIQELAQTFNRMLEKLKGYADLQVEKLIIEQKKTEAIIFSIEDGIIMTDYQGRIQLLSHRAKDILQIEGNAETLGQPLWKFLPTPELKTIFVDVLTKPEGKKSIEVKLPRDQKDRFYSLSSEQVRSPKNEETMGIVTVIHDITLEKELDSMKEEFLHSITHDLRNPLTAIRGFIRLFQSGQTGPLSEIQGKMFDTMEKASLRLLTMINDILDLARLEAGRMTLHLETFRLEELAGRVLELFSPQSRTNNIQLTLDLAGSTLPPLTADPNLIERVFTNLIGNASKFTPDGGSITLRLSASNDSFKCSVIDTGEGIPESYLEKVFDKFRQVEGRFKGGAGLGLTICKSIVEAHGGRIWVESEEGKGSNFILTIPRNLSLPRQEKSA